MPTSPPHSHFSNMIKSKEKYLDAIFMYCREGRWDDVWFIADIIILVTGVVVNAALLWLFLRERKSLSVSQVLGVNLVVMDLMYLSTMPVSLIYETQQGDQRVNRSDLSTIDWQGSNNTHSMDEVREMFSMFNLIGCPLLLACMCIERYLAVVRPVLYLRVRKWEYRMAVSAVVWVLTLSFCLATGVVDDITIMVSVTIIISCLFLLMLACLGGVVWSLQQQSPAHTSYGNQARSESPLKRQALGNVLVVVVPAVISYLPVLLMVPMVLYIYYWNNPLDEAICNVFELSWLFPRFGVLIGPLFYLSKAKQMCCLSETGKKFHE